MKLPKFLPGQGRSPQENRAAQGTAKKTIGKTSSADAVDQPAIRDDDEHKDTGSGASNSFKKQFAGAATDQSASTHTPNKSHIVNKEALAQQALAGPGSLDPNKLVEPAIPDARRWLAKRGIELSLPENWRFMGQQLDGRSISFNHSGTADGHTVEVSMWRLPNDVPVEKFLAAYVEEADDLVRLGRLSGHKLTTVGEASGILLIGWGPDSKPELDAIQQNPQKQDELYLATDGTMRRTMSWRGAVERKDEQQLIILSMTSPIETFFDARAVYDAVLSHANIVG